MNSNLPVLYLPIWFSVRLSVRHAFSQEKLRLQEEQERARREMEEERLRLQQLKVWHLILPAEIPCTAPITC